MSVQDTYDLLLCEDRMTREINIFLLPALSLQTNSNSGQPLTEVSIYSSSPLSLITDRCVLW